VVAASLKSFIEAKLPGAFLEEQRFGRAGAVAHWVEAASIARVAKLLKECPETRLDWLENLSCMQIDTALVLTYFVGASAAAEIRPLCLLRASVPVEGARELAEVPSVRASWTAAAPFEDEIAELFGVKFTPHKQGRRSLPAEVKGFPLRKGGAGAVG